MVHNVIGESGHLLSPAATVLGNSIRTLQSLVGHFETVYLPQPLEEVPRFSVQGRTLAAAESQAQGQCGQRGSLGRGGALESVIC